MRYAYRHPGTREGMTRTPILLLHGFGAAIAHWRNNVEVLGELYPVYALDFLGFGASRKAATGYSIEFWVEQVHDFWQAVIGEPVVLVGNSLGSVVALTAAASYPEMVKGLVLLNLPDVAQRQEMLPGWLLPIVTGIERAIASPLLLKLLFRFLRQPKILHSWAKFAYPNPNSIDQELIEILATPPQDEGAADAFYALCRAAQNPHFAPSAKALLARITVPIYLLWGTRDRMVSFSLAQSFIGINPQLKFVPLEGVGHCPHDEVPEQFNQLLLDWLEII